MENNKTNVDENATDANSDTNIVCAISGTSFGCGLCRWRKCFRITNRFVAELNITLQHFDNEHKRDIV